MEKVLIRIAIALCISGAMLTCTGAEKVRHFFPRWDLGDWWVVETEFLCSADKDPFARKKLLTRSDPVEYRLLKAKHRFQVESLEKLGDVDCYVLTVKAVDLPSCVANATKDEWLWKLWVRKEDMSLAKYEYRLHQGVYYVEGPVDSKGEYVYEAGMPAVPALRWRTPIDIPRMPDMPMPDTIEYIPNGLSKTTFKDANTGSEGCQFVHIVLERNDAGNLVPEVRVTIKVPSLGIRREVWHPHKPWFSRWECLSSDGDIMLGAQRAVLLNYGKAQPNLEGK